jgi:hypothetical protein
MAYRKFGLPEQLCGGQIAKCNVTREVMRYGHYALGEAFCQRMANRFPAAWAQYREGRKLPSLLANAVQRHATGLDGLENYGPATQLAIEAHVEATLADAQPGAELHMRAAEMKEREWEELTASFLPAEITKFIATLGTAARHTWGALPLADQKRQIREWLQTHPVMGASRR